MDRTWKSEKTMCKNDMFGYVRFWFLKLYDTFTLRWNEMECLPLRLTSQQTTKNAGTARHHHGMIRSCQAGCHQLQHQHGWCTLEKVTGSASANAGVDGVDGLNSVKYFRAVRDLVNWSFLLFFLIHWSSTPIFSAVISCEVLFACCTCAWKSEDQTLHGMAQWSLAKSCQGGTVGSGSTTLQQHLRGLLALFDGTAAADESKIPGSWCHQLGFNPLTSSRCTSLAASFVHVGWDHGVHGAQCPECLDERDERWLAIGIRTFSGLGRGEVAARWAHLEHARECCVREMARCGSFGILSCIKNYTTSHIFGHYQSPGKKVGWYGMIWRCWDASCHQHPSSVFQWVFHVLQDGWKWLPAWRHGAEQCCWWRQQNSRVFSPTWPLLLGKDSGDGSVIVDILVSGEAILVWSFLEGFWLPSGNLT